MSTRRYAAAIQPEIALTPEEGEALVADYEARAAHVAATCLPSVEAARRHMTAFVTGLGEVVPADFCAFVTAWEAKGFKGSPAALGPFFRLIEEIDERRGAGLRARVARRGRHPDAVRRPRRVTAA